MYSDLEQIGKIKKILQDKMTEFSPLLDENIEVCDKIIKACGEVEKTWSNSFAGYHGLLYYKDFQEPTIHQRFSPEWGGINGIPDGWNKKTADEVRKKIEELTGNSFSLISFESKKKDLVEEFKKIKTEILVILSSFELNDEMIQEKKLLLQIENCELTKTLGYFMKKLIPRTIMTRDSRALAEGICTPTHTYYIGVSQLVKDVSESIKNLLNITDRLVRQLEIKFLKQEIKKSEKSYWNYCNPFWLLYKISTKFVYLLKNIWKHKIASFILAVVGLLAIDYALLGKNTLKLILYVKLIFLNILEKVF